MNWTSVFVCHATISWLDTSILFYQQKLTQSSTYVCGGCWKTVTGLNHSGLDPVPLCLAKSCHLNQLLARHRSCLNAQPPSSQFFASSKIARQNVSAKIPDLTNLWVFGAASSRPFCDHSFSCSYSFLAYAIAATSPCCPHLMMRRPQMHSQHSPL